MSLLIYAKEDDKTKQIDLEDLFTKEQKRNQKMLSTFNKILNRIHKRIELTARQKVSDKHIFFLVPDFLLGEPNYHRAECIAYLVSKLESNDFLVRYIHPNTLYVSWGQYVPQFVRDQVKKKTGVVIDTKGVIVSSPQQAPPEQIEPAPPEKNKEDKKSKYKSTDVYKPSGQFVYGSDLFDKIERRVS